MHAVLMMLTALLVTVFFDTIDSILLEKRKVTCSFFVVVAIVDAFQLDWFASNFWMGILPQTLVCCR